MSRLLLREEQDSERGEEAKQETGEQMKERKGHVFTCTQKERDNNSHDDAFVLVSAGLASRLELWNVTKKELPVEG